MPKKPTPLAESAPTLRALVAEFEREQPDEPILKTFRALLAEVEKRLAQQKGSPPKK